MRKLIAVMLVLVWRSVYSILLFVLILTPLMPLMPLPIYTGLDTKLKDHPKGLDPNDLRYEYVGES